MNPAQRKRQAKILRVARKVHRTTGAVLFIFFFIVAGTGLMLGWKKHSAGVILPKSFEGKSANQQDWMPIHLLHERAVRVVRENISPTLPLELDRIDIRPDKGMVKFVFIEGYWGVQLDCTTGELLHIERRYADLIENVHDGSYLDYLFGTSDGQIKLVYTSVMGTALLTFTVSGFWLWYGPKRFRAHSKFHRYNI
ncbi:MAG TPA: PepSY domain-containing protein [Pyrinomonadaceae bacterium]|nr:PepSY domain-containing protein [Pyrinomonadaceae bacterium]